MKSRLRGMFAACVLLPLVAAAQQNTAPADTAAAAVPDPAYHSFVSAYVPAAAENETPDRRWLHANAAVAGGGMGHMMMAPSPKAAMTTTAHAGHDMSSMPAADPHAGHAMPVPQEGK